MKKTVIIVRCKTFDIRVSELIAQLQRSLSKWTIYAIPDCINLNDEECNRVCSEFPITTLPLTTDFVRENGLHFYQNRTGWLCGDYVIYRALEHQWDYVWVIEPDVYFLNGAEDIISRLERVDHDLLATHLWLAGDGWLGSGSLPALLPELKVHAMAFPFFRISRNVTEKALELRQLLTPLLEDSMKIPNDESIVASAAYNMEASMLDIRSLYEEYFSIWSTLTRVSIEDVIDSRSEPLVVHSGQLREKFLMQMQNYWKGAREGSEFCKRQLFLSLETASKETTSELLERILNNEIGVLK